MPVIFCTLILPRLLIQLKICPLKICRYILYLDFAKAFDTIDHVILIEKLKWYGVTGQLIDWFSDYLKDYLKDRSQIHENTLQ